MTDARPRGQCARCWRTHSLTKAGNVYRHKEVFYYPGSPARYLDCDGAGKPPLRQQPVSEPGSNE